jgi:hypothetical protein
MYIDNILLNKYEENEEKINPRQDVQQAAGEYKL